MTTQEIMKLPRGTKIQVGNRVGRLTFQKNPEGNEQKFGLNYVQERNQRFNQFTLKKGTECVCYDFQASEYKKL